MRNKEWIFWLLGYVVFALAIVAAMFTARSAVLASLGTAEARQDWGDWRNQVKQDVERQDQPTSRRVPKSDEPPGLVLMRDYFAVSLGMLLLLSTVLYAMIAVGVRAIFLPSTAAVATSGDRAPNSDHPN